MITLAENTPSGTNPGPTYAPRNDPSHTNGNGGTEAADLVVLLDSTTPAPTTLTSRCLPRRS
jgi:hypothetical protein